LVALESSNRKLSDDAKNKQDQLDKLTHDLQLKTRELTELKRDNEEMRTAIAGTLGGFMKK
jgi:chromosome segregation ATPase